MMHESDLSGMERRTQDWLRPAAAARTSVAALVLCLVVLACSAASLAAPFDVNGEVYGRLVGANDAEPTSEVEYDGLEFLLSAGSEKNDVFAGAASFKWGPGRSGSLMLSGKAQPMPVVGYRLKRGNSEYMRFVGFMESEQQRRLIGHRLEYAPTCNVLLGVSETAAVSGDAAAALYLPFPGFPLYALQHVVNQRDRAQDRLVNINLGADFRVRWELPEKMLFGGAGESGPLVSSLPWLELYGEVFIDDAQGHVANRPYIPDMVGGLIGVDFPELPWDPRFGANIEYVGIANFVYSHKNPDNNYVYRGAVLGHPLGPDSDVLVLTVSFRPSSNTAFTLSGAVERHGEGSIGQSWSRQYECDDWFLSGVVEKTTKVSAGVERALVGPTVLVGSIEYAMKANSDHVMGQSATGWGAKIGIGVKL